MDIEEQYDKIYHYCYFKIYDKQLAQDITQETFLRFYKQELNFDSSKHLPYLYTIARNLCIDEFRKKAIESLENFQDEAIYDPCEEWVDNLTQQNNQTTTSNFPCNFNFTVSNMNRFNQGIDHG